LTKPAKSLLIKINKNS